MKEKRIWNFIAGEGNQQERSETLLWIKEDEERMAKYHRLKRNFALSGHSEHLSDYKIEQAYKKCMPDMPLKVYRFKSTMLEIGKYAATFIVACLISWVILSKQYGGRSTTYTLVETLPGQSSKTILPDGSVVWLNGDTKLSYASNFSLDGKRDVHLNGEAYFDVRHSEEEVFRVKTDAAIINVLGTEFNVVTNNDNEMVTTLVNGEVEISGLNGNYLTSMKPGQQVTYLASSNQLKKGLVDVEFYSSWKDGYIDFNDQSLGAIVPRLERLYNVEIQFEKVDLADVKISGRALRNVPVEMLFQVLEVTFGIQYELTPSIEGKSVILIKESN